MNTKYLYTYKLLIMKYFISSEDLSVYSGVQSWFCYKITEKRSFIIIVVIYSYIKLHINIQGMMAI